jgi:HCOMODA/2-hydroxy-3-carboxy-muconic semialdehyde decarboxylase
MLTEDDIREDLVVANQIMANEGIIRGFGHVSARIPETDELLISRAISPALVTEDDLVRMDLDGNVVDDSDFDTYKETVIHRAIYRNRDDVGAVIHHHAPSVMPFTITDTELQPAFHMGALFADGVPTFEDYDTDYGLLVVTEDEGDRMAEQLGNRRGQLLAAHGANVVGTTLKEAVLSTVYFVMNARFQFQAHQLGEPDFFTGPPEMVETAVDDVLLSAGAIDRMWTYLKSTLPN